MKKSLLRALGMLSIVVFIPLFLFTFADPQLIEHSASSFIEWKLQHATNAKIEAITLPKASTLEEMLGQKATTLRLKTDQRLATLKAQLKEDAPAILADQIAKVRNLNCECRQK